MYYKNKTKSLQRIFGTTDIVLNDHFLHVKGSPYPIRNDVIVLTPPDERSNAPDIQFTFGQEWQSFQQILPEHKREFAQYFDLVDLASLQGQSVCDLGCGSGRWSTFLKDRCRELILVDFSDAIFVARRNLAGADHCLFFKGDLTKLPFAGDFSDFLFCLGVLHHLPIPCVEAVRNLRRYAPTLLIFLYYALDNRPVYFRWLLQGVTGLRLVLARIRSRMFREGFSWFGTLFLYLPLIGLGSMLEPLKLGHKIPLYEFYRGKRLSRIRQDVYDRFFTRIEQRVSRQEIRTLQDTFRQVEISPNLPYWHFLCRR
jgi:SAM-dependent methyltransferase